MDGPRRRGRGQDGGPHCPLPPPRFEQEVLGAPVSVPPVVDAVPVALAVPAVPPVPPVPALRPIIATNTYQQVTAWPGPYPLNLYN